jgi:hypothetical protein
MNVKSLRTYGCLVGPPSIVDQRWAAVRYRTVERLRSATADSRPCSKPSLDRRAPVWAVEVCGTKRAPRVAARAREKKAPSKGGTFLFELAAVDVERGIIAVNTA